MDKFRISRTFDLRAQFFWLKPIEEVAFNALSGSPVVILDELEEVAAGEILSSGASVFVVQARLHVFREGKIESELAGVGKGEGCADPVGSFKGNTLQRSCLGCRHHASHAKSRCDGELGMNRNGKEKVGKHRNLIVVADEGGLTILGYSLGADRERSIGGFDVLNRVEHEPRREFQRKPVGYFGSNRTVHPKARVEGKGGGSTAHRCAAGAS